MVEISPITLVEVVIGIFLAILAVVIIPIVRHFRAQDLAHTKEITQVRADITQLKEIADRQDKIMSKGITDGEKAHDRLEQKIDKMADNVTEISTRLARMEGKDGAAP